MGTIFRILEVADKLKRITKEKKERKLSNFKEILHVEMKQLNREFIEKKT